MAALILILLATASAIFMGVKGVQYGADGLGYGKKAQARREAFEDNRIAKEIDEKITKPLASAQNAREALAPTEALAFYIAGNGLTSLSEDYRGWLDSHYTRLGRAARTEEEANDVAGLWSAVWLAGHPGRDDKAKQAELFQRFWSAPVEAVKTQRINTEASGNDLRPQRLVDVIGQDKVTQQIGLLISAAKARGDVLDHMLLAGPPGLGKTTLALIVANEMGTHLHVTSGPDLRSTASLHALLKALQPGDLLFIDEIHRMPQIVNEALYIAVEDYRADIDGERVTLPRFTLVGATTHAGLIPGPLRDRFGYTGFLEPYNEQDLAVIVTRNASKLKMAHAFTRGAGREIAARSKGTPRVANNLLKRVRDYWQSNYPSVNITRKMASDAIEMFDIDTLGLDRLDRHVLSTLARYDSPIGIKTLSAATGEAEESVEESEGFMIRLGFIDRTPRGRLITPAGRSHLLA